MKTIVAATKNKHKIDEIEAITKDFGMNIISRDKAGVPSVEVEETGTTFEENSYLKAYEIMKLCGEITIADDSGLVVDCIGGAPGVYSSRFSEFQGIWPDESCKSSIDDAHCGDGNAKCEAPAETKGTDVNNNAKLISLIKDIPFEERTARFVSVITMIFPDGNTIVARGEVEGHVILEERGQKGFGYDPMFVPLGFKETFGELSAEIKNGISHRANALKVLRKKLEKVEENIEKTC